ncbi:hypothetical protein EBO34_11280 [Alteribacter keqinensis]|uniref:Uncharacterized protein n=1 Tax=Alteribacter keqinensis TaxID=2483800 RepID=A0A3M7U004_9BACI|nr:hypothetical protein EBO34_11280 [Alteribacter keqinensis]
MSFPSRQLVFVWLFLYKLLPERVRRFFLLRKQHQPTKLKKSGWDIKKVFSRESQQCANIAEYISGAVCLHCMLFVQIFVD